MIKPSARPHGESGAVATIVAVLLGFGVVLGMLALAVDAGGIMVERRGLQNGADAAALSLAQSCAEKNCEENADGLLDLANVNALDSQHSVDSQCGENIPGDASTGDPLDGCPDVAWEDMNMAKCPPLPPSLAELDGLPFVEVRTSSLSEDGAFIRNIFSDANGGDDTTTVHACARAAWGTPGARAATAPVTFSTCEFQAMIERGDSVWDPPIGSPGYDDSPATEVPDWPANSSEQGVFLQSTSGGKTPIPGCETFNGHDTAGGFGYLSGDDCSTVITDDDWVQGETGNNPKDCDISGLWKTVVDIPVFDCMKPGTSPKPSGAPTGTCDDYADAEPGKGASNWYHIVGWAKFYVSGYQTGGTGTSERSVLTNNQCKDYTSAKGGSDRCLMGWFVSGVLGDAEIVAAPGSGGIDFGTYAVAAAG